MDSLAGFWLLHQKGCPIRKPPDQSLFAAPRGISVLTPSFIASSNLVILHRPLVAWPSYIKLSKSNLLIAYRESLIVQIMNDKDIWNLSYSPVEQRRFELPTSCLQSTRSPNWATAPYLGQNQLFKSCLSRRPKLLYAAGSRLSLIDSTG